MLTPSDFQTYAQWTGIAVLVLGALTGLGFLFQWGIRFRLIGATGFTVVLTVGLFALGLVPLTRTSIPDAVRYVTVFDSGADQAVIAVSTPITETELAATLKQAASNLYSLGRLSRGDQKLTIRARAVVHPEPGVSQPLYLGQIKRSLSTREDAEMELKLYPEALAQLSALSASPDIARQDG